jgi:ATP-dependent exoDNAse (exonuclease V) alpha subunit
MVSPGHAETVHSYQGDEAEEIIMAVDRNSYPRDGRLVYTAVTRARERLVVIDPVVITEPWIDGVFRDTAASLGRCNVVGALPGP